MKKGFPANVYRRDSVSQPRNLLPDDARRVVIVNAGIDFTVEYDDELALEIKKKQIGTYEHIYAKPVGHEGHTMFGGNFVWSGDSRFGEKISKQPIPIHDRVEK